MPVWTPNHISMTPNRLLRNSNRGGQHSLHASRDPNKLHAIRTSFAC